MNKIVVKKRNKAKSFLKGFSFPLFFIFQSKLNFFSSILVMMFCVFLTFLTNGRIMLFFIVLCSFMGAFQVINGIIQIYKSSNAKDLLLAYEEIGIGSFSILVALLSIPQAFSKHVIVSNLNKNFNINKKLSESLSAALGSLDDIACFISSLAVFSSEKTGFNND